MTNHQTLRRHGVIALAFALILAAAILFADAASPRHVGAVPADLEQQTQGLVVDGSRIDVYVLDRDMANLQWEGVIEDPLGNDLAWNTWNSVGSFTGVGVFQDVEEGEFTVIPGAPVAAGWEVHGYRIIAGGGWSHCGLDALTYTDDPTFEVNAANPEWVVCVAVIPAGGIPGSLVTVSFVAPNMPGDWAGKMDIPSGTEDPLFSELIDSGSFVARWHHGKAGMYWTFPTNQPKPGLWTYGFYSFESDSLFPDCPADPSFYQPSATYFLLTEEKPHWAMCILAVDTVPDLRLTLKVDGPLGVPWSGNHVAAGVFTPWADWGVDATSNVASSTDIPPITQMFQAGSPIAPGWIVVGVAVFESTNPNPACPTGVQAYQPYGVVYVSPHQPAWAVCYKVAELEPMPGTHIQVRVNSQWGPTGYVDGPGGLDFSWYSISLQAASASGYREDVPAGTYTVVPDAPPLPGYTVAGFYQMETSDPWDFCPQDVESYSPNANAVTISAQHPVWTICVYLVEQQQQAPEPDPDPEPDPSPVQPDPSPSPAADPTPDVPNYYDPGMPGAAQDPQPTATATPNTPTATPPATTPTAVPTQPVDDPQSTPEPAETPASAGETPGGGQGNQGGAGAAPTPAAPNTGDALYSTGGAQHRWLEGGFVLLGLLAIGVAAGWLPVRRKR